MTLAILLVTLLAATNPPATAQEWFQQGVTRHDSGDYAGALESFRKAAEMNYSAPNILSLRMARTYARLGKKDEAYAQLGLAIERGFGQSDQLNAQDDFIPLRDDHRWRELITLAQKNLHPCRNAPESRQFDFWLGEWDVEQGGQKIARSSIQLVLDECVIFENYEMLTGTYAGKSLSAWDSGEKRWEQHYTDTAGGSRTWAGTLQNEKMVMRTELVQNGANVTNRMTYSKEGPDRVRQFIETSLDGGKTWSIAFDVMYVRRK